MSFVGSTISTCGVSMEVSHGVQESLSMDAGKIFERWSMPIGILGFLVICLLQRTSFLISCDGTDNASFSPWDIIFYDTPSCFCLGPTEAFAYQFSLHLSQKHGLFRCSCHTHNIILYGFCQLSCINNTLFFYFYCR